MAKVPERDPKSGRFLSGKERHQFRNWFGKWKLPGWVAWVLLLVKLIPDAVSRYGFWVDMAKAAGGYMSTVAAVVYSWPFNLGLFLFGFLWLLFVGEPRKGMRHHPSIVFAGWVVIGCVVGGILVVALNGYIEVAKQEAVSARENPPARFLTREQIAGIKKFVCPDAAKFQPIAVLSVAPTEAMNYGKQIITVLNDCGVSVQLSPGENQQIPVERSTADPTRKGIIIPVFDKTKPDEKSKLLESDLMRAGLFANFAEWEGGPPGVVPNTTIFISYP